MIIWKRIKYRQALREYKQIVASISDLTVGLLKDLSSIDDFLGYPDSDDLLILAEIQDLGLLIVRYNNNALAHPSTILALSKYGDVIRQFRKLIKLKSDFITNTNQLVALQSVAPQIEANEDEAALEMHIKMINTSEKMVFDVRNICNKIHSKLLMDTSAMRNAIRIENIDVKTNTDIIKDHFKGKKKHSRIELKISDTNKGESSDG